MMGRILFIERFVSWAYTHFRHNVRPNYLVAERKPEAARMIDAMMPDKHAVFDLM